MAEWVSFAKVKEQVSIQQVLEHYGLVDGLRRQKNGEELAGLCPFHEETKGSFHVSLSKNAFQCFGCKRKGNILDFVIYIEGLQSHELRKAALLVAEWFHIAPEKAPGATETVKVEEPAVKLPEEEVNPPLTFELKNLDAKHPYLTQRGLAPLTIKEFGLGYCGRGLMKDRVVIPIHNPTGELVAYAGRTPGEPPEGEPKYKVPPNFKKSLVLYNLHRVAERAKEEQHLILVEGFFDAFRIWEAGFENVVALMGSELCPAQTHLLTTVLGRAGRVTLLLDDDKAGHGCQEQCIELLVPHLYIKAVSLPDGVAQPDELTEKQTHQLLAG